MSKTVKLGAMATAVLTIATALLPATALSQANCQWYGTTALKQQQDNERLKCGLTGSAWSSDLKAHMSWCASVAPDMWRQAARKRDQDLAACAAKARK